MKKWLEWTLTLLDSSVIHWSDLLFRYDDKVSILIFKWVNPHVALRNYHVQPFIGFESNNFTIKPENNAIFFTTGLISVQSNYVNTEGERQCTYGKWTVYHVVDIFFNTRSPFFTGTACSEVDPKNFHRSRVKFKFVFTEFRVTLTLSLQHFLSVVMHQSIKIFKEF